MLCSFQPEGGTLWLLIAIPEKHKYSNKSQSFYFFSSCGPLRSQLLIATCALVTHCVTHLKCHLSCLMFVCSKFSKKLVS